MHNVKKIKKNRGFASLFRSIFLLAFIALALQTIAIQKAEAREMAQRLGVGIENPYWFNLPALSVHYYPNNDIGYVGNFGIDTEDNHSRLGLGGGIRKNIFKETNLNFFMQGSLAYESVEEPDVPSSTTHTGFEVSALMGAEFFLQGIENLGFNILGGASVSTVDKSRFRTVGLDFLHAGLIFYF